LSLPLSNPDNLDKILIHEMVHVAQSFKVASYWREGLADYVRYKLGYTNGWACPQCSEDYPHYTSGYWCAGAFLLWMDAIYGTKLIHELNQALRRGSYSEELFSIVTGKTLAEL